MSLRKLILVRIQYQHKIIIKKGRLDTPLDVEQTEKIQQEMHRAEVETRMSRAVKHGVQGAWTTRTALQNKLT